MKVVRPLEMENFNGNNVTTRAQDRRRQSLAIQADHFLLRVRLTEPLPDGVEAADLWTVDVITTQIQRVGGRSPINIVLVSDSEAILTMSTRGDPGRLLAKINALDEWVVTEARVDLKQLDPEEVRELVGDELDDPTNPNDKNGEGESDDDDENEAERTARLEQEMKVKMNEVAERVRQEEREKFSREMEASRERFEQERQRLLERQERDRANFKREFEELRERSSAQSVSTSRSSGGPHGLIDKPPTVGRFSGERPGKGNDISYRNWRYQVMSASHTHTERMVRHAVITSLGEGPAEIVRALGETATVKQIVDKLDLTQQSAKPRGALFTEFYELRQKDKETIGSFAMRMEAVWNEIKENYPERLPEKDREMKEKLYTGMRKEYRNTFRYLYTDSRVTYDKLLTEVKAIETDTPQNEESVRVKAAVASPVNAETSATGLSGSSVESLLKELVQIKSAIVKSNTAAERKPKGSGWKVDEAGNRVPKCYNCQEWGHMARECTQEPRPRGQGNGQRDGGSRPAATAPTASQ